MWGILAKVFGSDTAIKKGGELIDELWETESEKIEAKTSAKVEMLRAAAPFKISQRVIAWSVTFVVLLSFLTAFGITIWDFFTDEQIRNAEGDTIVDVLVTLLDAFKIGWAWTLIMTFYFGAGLIDGVQERRAQKVEEETKKEAAKRARREIPTPR